MPSKKNKAASQEVASDEQEKPLVPTGDEIFCIPCNKWVDIVEGELPPGLVAVCTDCPHKTRPLNNMPADIREKVKEPVAEPEPPKPEVKPEAKPKFELPKQIELPKFEPVKKVEPNPEPYDYENNWE